MKCRTPLKKQIEIKLCDSMTKVKISLNFLSQTHTKYYIN